MVRELKEKVFPNREVRYVRMNAQGKTVMAIAATSAEGNCMTWFIDPGRFPITGAVTEYVGAAGPPNPIVRSGPLSETELGRLPKEFKFHARLNGFEHILLDQSGYLLLSQPAPDVLEQLQTKGWNAIPLTPVGINEKSRKSIASDNYYLLDIYLRVDAFDLHRGNIQPQVLSKGTPLETIVYRLDEKHRDIAIRRDAVSGLAIWVGILGVFAKIIFASDELRRLWCKLGVPEELFEPCIDA